MVEINSFYAHSFTDEFGTNDLEAALTTIHEECIHILNIILHSEISHDNPDLYSGVGGILYACYRAADSGLFDSQFREILSFALLQLEKCFKSVFSKSLTPTPQDFSLVFGLFGLYISACLIYKLDEDVDNYQDLLTRIVHLSKFGFKEKLIPEGEDSLFLGRCGFLRGVQFLKKFFDSEILNEVEIEVYIRMIFESCSDWSRRRRSVLRLTSTYNRKELTGIAYGISGILYTLLFEPLIFNHGCFAQPIKRTLEYLVNLQSSSGNFDSSIDDTTGINDKVSWHDSSSGIIWLLLKAYEVFGSEMYLKAAKNSADYIFSRGAVFRGAGLYDGVAGNGYAFLRLYQVTGEIRYYYRAVRFALFLFSDEFQQRMSVPGNPLGLFEGLSGTLCFLLDVLQPYRAAFPFL